MSDQRTDHRFYGDLAAWWPLISPPEEYEEEAAYLATVLSSASIPVHDVLELGSGGGHSAVHLKAAYSMTLVDLSPDMLAVSQVLNPECPHIAGDMRTVRLGRTFDAVLVHDAVDYMLDDDDLRRLFETSFVHCRPGGVAVFVPDQTRETYEDDTDHGGTDGDDGRGVRYLQWTWDPDPSDSWIRTEYSFLLRGPDGAVRAVHETHRTGLFSRADWLRLVRSAGFEAASLTEVTTEPRTPRDIFVGHRPSP